MPTSYRGQTSRTSILKIMGDFKSFVRKKVDLAIFQEDTGTNFPRKLYIHLTVEYKLYSLKKPQDYELRILLY
jgi:hypothetical protein